MKPQSEFSIFLVDDDPFFVSICEKMLQNLDYKNIISFQSATEFLLNIRQKPDVILLDYNMDSLNGLEILQKIKRYNPNQLVVFISGQEEKEIVVSALKCGAFDYIYKNQITEKRLKILLENCVDLKKSILKNYMKRVFGRVITTIGVPILVWLLLESFFS
jgi:DNA-binding NtrC family response regulator